VEELRLEKQTAFETRSEEWRNSEQGYRLEDDIALLGTSISRGSTRGFEKMLSQETTACCYPTANSAIFTTYTWWNTSTNSIAF
jgi:hypothetical protein